MIKEQIKSFFKYHIRYSPFFWKKFHQVKQVKTANHSKIQELRNEAFIRVFRKAFQNSAFYRELYQQHGITLHSIQSLEDIKMLPVINRKQVRDQADNILIGSKWTKTVGLTSGTTGTPLKVYRDYNSVLTEAAFIWAQRNLCGYLPGMKTVSLRGDLGRSDLYKFDSFSNTLFLSSYNLKEEQAVFFYDKIAHFSPYAILAYPSSVYILATYLKNAGKSLKVPYIFTSSETLYDFQREAIEKVFNGKVVDWYGNAERTIAIEQHQDGKYYEIPLYSINEYQQECTITTSLINDSFPLIRYQVNDIIEPAERTDNKTQEIKRIAGRIDDILVLPDSTKVGRLDVVFKGVENVEFAQFVQKQQDTFVLNLVTNPYFTDADKKKLISNLKHRIGKEVSFTINLVGKEEIIFSKSNKYKLVINETKNQSAFT